MSGRFLPEIRRGRGLKNQAEVTAVLPGTGENALGMIWSTTLSNDCLEALRSPECKPEETRR